MQDLCRQVTEVIITLTPPLGNYHFIYVRSGPSCGVAAATAILLQNNLIFLLKFIILKLIDRAPGGFHLCFGCKKVNR